MPQEVSVSYQAVKSKVYRLIDSLVVGEKTEAEVQESIRRWWELIHPADRPIAQKYLLIVLERSASALDSIEEGLLAATDLEVSRPPESVKALKLVGRMVKQTTKHAALSTTV
jgi:hypothetical protein